MGIMRKRILLADDHPIVLKGFQRLLEDKYEVVGAVEDGAALVAEAEVKQPDLVLVDIGMRVLNGFEAASRLKAKVPHVKVLFISFHEHPSYVAKALQVGASGYLLKEASDAEILHAIETVLAGQTYLSPLVADQLREVQSAPTVVSPQDPMQLSSRQRQVLQLVAEGHSHREIAEMLNVTTKTVEYHKSRLMKQLGLRTDAALTRCAIAHGLVILDRPNVN
jgi:DNA-binding NarL/FixJ family response regulator